MGEEPECARRGRGVEEVARTGIAGDDGVPANALEVPAIRQRRKMGPIPGVVVEWAMKVQEVIFAEFNWGLRVPASSARKRSRCLSRVGAGVSCATSSS